MLLNVVHTVTTGLSTVKLSLTHHRNCAGFGLIRVMTMKILSFVRAEVYDRVTLLP